MKYWKCIIIQVIIFTASSVWSNTNQNYNPVVSPEINTQESLSSYAIKLMPFGGVANDQFGNAVSIDGDVALVSAVKDNASTGSAYIFERNANGTNVWYQVAQLTASDGMGYDYFGNSISIDGDVALIGAPYDDNPEANSGSAYIFERNAGGTNAWGQVAKLVPLDNERIDQFGYSVAIAGNIALVSAPYDDDMGSDSGSAYIFDRNAGGTNAWGQIAKLTASDGTNSDNFGNAVSIAGDVAIIGVQKDDDSGTSSGSAYIFGRNARGSNAWGQVAKLIAPNGKEYDRFGISVSIDGDIALVGSNLDDDMGEASGSAYIFERNAGGTNAWGLTAKLTASDGTTEDYFGYSVSIAGDAVLIGAYGDDDNGSLSGSVYIFERNAGETNAWGQTRKLIAPDGTMNYNFGRSVSIDGDVALIGMEYDWSAGAYSGSAYIMPISIEAKNLSETAKLTVSDGTTNDGFAYSVSIDGDIALGGTPYDNGNSGSAYILERHTGGTNAWGQVTKLTALDTVLGDYFGCCVSADGGVALIGAVGYSGFLGSAYIFERNANGTNKWGQVAKLTALDGTGNDWFGHSVSIAGDVALVGAHLNNDMGDGSGSAYIFERNADGTNVWGQVAKLTASDGTTNDYLGMSVSVDGDVALVSACYDDDTATNSGSVYIFERNAGGTNAWGQTAKLIASDGDEGDHFGHSVSVGGDVALVGVYHDNTPEEDSGSAYVFERNAGGINRWGQVAKLTSPDGASNNYFGISVSVAGDIIIVGASKNDDAGRDAGSAYVFERNANGTNAWGHVAKLTASDSTTNGLFGFSVSADGDAILIGAYGDDDAGSKSGSAYIFEQFFPVPKPTIVDVTFQNSNTVCSWTASEPVDYTVQYKDRMENNIVWSNLTGYINIPGQNGPMTATNTTTSIQKRFYRVKASNSPIR